MNKGDIVEIKSPNEVTITAIVLDCISTAETRFGILNTYLCYSQNRLFTYSIEYYQEWIQTEEDKFEYQFCEHNHKFGSIICEYCIIPGLDEVLLS